MEIIGIGNDILQISRVQDILYKNQNFCMKRVKLFKNRILSDDEKKILASRQNESDIISFFAKVFSVKESIAKSIGSGFTQNLYFKNLTIYRNDLGKPYVTEDSLNYISKLFFSNRNLRIEIAISDEREYVFTSAIAWLQ